MPDFNDQFGRFMDQFQRDSRDNSRNSEETVNTLRELLEEQRKMREEQEEMNRQMALDLREKGIEDERAKKAQREHETKVEKGDTKGDSILGELLGLFKSPAVLGAAIGLGFVDSLTKVNLTETIFAGTLLSKFGGEKLLKGIEKVSLAGTKGVGKAGKAMMGVKGTGAAAATVRGAGAAVRGGAAATGGLASGIFKTIGGLIKPFLSLLKPVMSVVKLFARASVVLTPIIAVFDGVMKAFEVFQEGGSISEVIMGFLIGALESLTTGILEGITTLGEWILEFVMALPDMIGNLFDGLLDFISMLFGGSEDSKIGGMIWDFAKGLLSAILGLLGMLWKLIPQLLVLPFKLMGKMIGAIFPGVGEAIVDFFGGIADWVSDLWDWFWSSDEEWEQMKRDKENKRKQKELEDARKEAEAANDDAAFAALDAELAALKLDTAETEKENAEKQKEAAELNKETADTNLETAEEANKDAEKTQNEVIGKLKGLGDITKGLLKSYGGSIKAFLADPAAAVGSINQASERGAERQYGGFDWAQKLTPFGGERDMFEKTAAAQNIGTTMMHESMAAEMAARKSERGSGTAVVNNAPNTTVVNNAKTHTQIPRGTRHTDRSLDRANRRDGLKI